MRGRPVALTLALLACAGMTACSSTPSAVPTTGSGGSGGSGPLGSPTTSVTPAPTPTPMTGDQIYALERTGVVRVQATTCDGSGSGSGYFISDRMVVTAAHVVE